MCELCAFCCFANCNATRILCVNILYLTVQNQNIQNTKPADSCGLCDWSTNLQLSEEHLSQDLQLSLTPEDPGFATHSSPDVIPEMSFSASFFRVSIPK